MKTLKQILVILAALIPVFGWIILSYLGFQFKWEGDTILLAFPAFLGYYIAIWPRIKSVFTSRPDFEIVQESFNYEHVQEKAYQEGMSKIEFKVTNKGNEEATKPTYRYVLIDKKSGEVIEEDRGRLISLPKKSNTSTSIFFTHKSAEEGFELQVTVYCGEVEKRKSFSYPKV